MKQALQQTCQRLNAISPWVGMATLLPWEQNQVRNFESRRPVSYSALNLLRTAGMPGHVAAGGALRLERMKEGSYSRARSTISLGRVLQFTT